MKRLWMRLGVVAGILGVGGAGVLVAQKGSSSSTEPTAVAAVSDADGGDSGDDNRQQPRPIPMEQNSLGAEGSALASPAAGAGNSDYANELDPSELSNSARFVAPPAPSRYGSSPASYSINDTDSNSVSEADTSAEPQSFESPTSSYASGYASTYAGDELPPQPSEPTYASRYGDPSEAAPESGSSLQSPQVLSETGSRYGEPVEQDAVPERPAPVAEQAGEGDAHETESSQLADTDPAPVTDSNQTIEPPPLRPDAAPEPSRYAPVEPAPVAAQPQLVSQSTLAPPPAEVSKFAASSVNAGSAALVASPLASDTPGTRDLEGAQTPTLTLEKRAPSEVSVGQASPWKIIVRNVGNVTAHGVVVTDRVPQGTQLVDASPEFTQTSDGALAWQLGDLEPGDTAEVGIELMPLVEGEIGSVAQVTFRAQASVRTISTKPELVAKHTGPEKVLIGEDVVFDIVLSNPGSGATTGIVIEEDVPEGLTHVAGEKLEYEVGTLRPKEEKRLQLVLRADKAGVVENLLRVKANGGLEATNPFTLEVIAPDLQVAIGGPRTRYLERQVTYEVAVANPGTSTAYDIQLVTFLPKGLKYVSADNKGAYDARRHAVYWSLAELPAQESGSVQLTALPVETGEQKLLVEGTANLNLSAKYEHTTNVQALTELAFTVQDVHDPIEVGSETVYEIRVVNNGNKVATNVQIAAAMPESLTPLNGEGPTKVIVEGQQLYMEPLARIAPRDEAVYRITARGTAAGDHVIAVQLASDEVPTPVTKQESTKVYADQ